MTKSSGSTPATLESLKALLDETSTVEIEPYGTFTIRQIAVKEFIELQDAAKVDGETDEWEATRLLLGHGVVDPPIGDDDELMGALPLSLVRSLTKAISEFSGATPDLGGGSLTA